VLLKTFAAVAGLEGVAVEVEGVVAVGLAAVVGRARLMAAGPYAVEALEKLLCA